MGLEFQFCEMEVLGVGCTITLSHFWTLIYTKIRCLEWLQSFSNQKAAEDQKAGKNLGSQCHWVGHDLLASRLSIM